MPPLLIPGTIAFAGTVTAVTNTATGGPDYIGIAAVISAAAGAVGTLVMAYIALTRRRQETPPMTPEQMADVFRDVIDEKKRRR